MTSDATVTATTVGTTSMSTATTGTATTTATWRAAALLDELLPQPVLVVGSPPAEARDLDLLVRSGDRAQVVDGLRRIGLVQQGAEWVGLPDSDLAGALVEVVDGDALGLPDSEWSRLHDTARPIDGMRRLVRPGPDAVLLLLAWQLGASGLLDPRRRRRIARALEEDPQAWSTARAAAGHWSAAASLGWLHEAYAATGKRSGMGSAGARLRATRERLQDSVPGARRLPLRAGARAVVGPRAPVPVLALSGLDGSGKSTQARLLADALDAAGFDVVVMWDRLGYSPALKMLTGPLRLALRLLPGATTRLAEKVELAHLHDEPGGEFEVAAEHRATRGLRERMPWLGPPWVTAVTLVNAVPLRRRVRRAVTAGKVVVFDRYGLDSRVHLQARYGESQVGFQLRLLRRLVPEPLGAYYVDVPAEVAYARKPEEHRVEALQHHRDLYLREAARSKVRVIDGRGPAEAIAALLLADALDRLDAPSTP